MKPEELRPIARQLLRTYQVQVCQEIGPRIGQGDLTSWEQVSVLCNEGEPSNSMFVTIEGASPSAKDAHIPSYYYSRAFYDRTNGSSGRVFSFSYVCCTQQY